MRWFQFSSFDLSTFFHPKEVRIENHAALLTELNFTFVRVISFFMDEIYLELKKTFYVLLHVAESREDSRGFIFNIFSVDIYEKKQFSVINVP